MGKNKSKKLTKDIQMNTLPMAKHQRGMVAKRFLLAILLWVLPCGMAYSQNNNAPKSDANNSGKIRSDSITERYYPGMFHFTALNSPKVPVPTQSSVNYRSRLGEIRLPGDTVRFVVEIMYSSRKDCVSKNYGMAWMTVKRFTDGKIQPFDTTVGKRLKRLRKRLKLKLETTMYDHFAGKTKTLTVYVNYDAINPRDTKIKWEIRDYKK